jgi:heme-degrading monooxygenase HmoA
MISPQTRHVYRVDKFSVPTAAREEFLKNVRNIHQLLQAFPGFVQDFLIEQSTSPDSFNLMTFIEWDSQESVENAKAKVNETYKQTGFDPQALIARLGIKADMATYKEIEV